MTDPRPVHTHVWHGGVLPAWLDGHHHDDHGRLIILTPDSEARPEDGWWLIGWSNGAVTAASPWTGRHVYGPDGIAARLERAEAALSLVRTVADLIADGAPVYASREALAARLLDAATIPEREPTRGGKQSARTIANNPPTSKETTMTEPTIIAPSTPLAEALAEAERYKQDHLNACQTVAAMHAAATGRTGEGSIRGVVEDVEDVRLRAERAETAIEQVKKLLDTGSIGCCAHLVRTALDSQDTP